MGRASQVKSVGDFMYRMCLEIKCKWSFTLQRQQNNGSCNGYHMILFLIFYLFLFFINRTHFHVFIFQPECFLSLSVVYCDSTTSAGWIIVKVLWFSLFLQDTSSSHLLLHSINLQSKSPPGLSWIPYKPTKGQSVLLLHLSSGKCPIWCHIIVERT